LVHREGNIAKVRETPQRRRWKKSSANVSRSGASDFGSSANVSNRQQSSAKEDSSVKRSRLSWQEKEIARLREENAGLRESLAMVLGKLELRLFCSSMMADHKQIAEAVRNA
jgi:hypothetical protein